MSTADETHTIRLPAGAANRLRAATGQKLSTLVRFMVMELLRRKEIELLDKPTPKVKLQEDIAALPDYDPNTPEGTSDGR